MKRTMLLTLFLLGCLPAYPHAYEIGDVEIHGFVSQGYLQSSANNYLAATEKGTFEFNEMGINFASWVIPGLRVGMQFFARDLGDAGNDEIRIDWATGEYHWKEWLNIRAGKMKMPHGLYNETRDIDLLRTSIFLPNSVYMEELRDELSALKGGGIFGRFSLGNAGGLLYQALYGGADIRPDSGFTRRVQGILAEMGIPVAFSRNNIEYLAAGSLQWETFLNGLLLSSTFVRTSITMQGFVAEDILAPVPTQAGDPFLIDFDNLNLSTYSLEYRHQNLLAAAEYMRIISDYTQNFESSLAGNVVVPMKNDMEGYYGNLSYRFNDWFELGSYYSVYYFDRGIKEETFINYQKDWAVSTRFDLNEFWIVKLEGHLMRGTAFMSVLDNDVPSFPDDLDPNWYLFAAKVTFVF